MPGFCTRLASICRAEVHQRHVHQTVMVHQTLQWHPPPAGKGGQLSFTKASVSFQVSFWLWLRQKEVFQSPIPIFISSSLNDSATIAHRATGICRRHAEKYILHLYYYWSKAFKHLVVTFSVCETKKGICQWWGNTFLPRPQTSHGTLRHIWNNALLCWAQPWWLPASLKQCSFVATLEHSSSLSEATRNVALSVKCLSLCKVCIPLCPPSSVSPMVTRSLAVDLILALSLIVNWQITTIVWRPSAVHNRG